MSLRESYNLKYNSSFLLIYFLPLKTIRCSKKKLCIKMALYLENIITLSGLRFRKCYDDESMLIWERSIIHSMGNYESKFEIAVNFLLNDLDIPEDHILRFDNSCQDLLSKINFIFFIQNSLKILCNLVIYQSEWFSFYKYVWLRPRYSR
jgi:hypothetical protein